MASRVSNSRGFFILLGLILPGILSEVSRVTERIVSRQARLGNNAECESQNSEEMNRKWEELSPFWIS
jgi:hypothetical protein